MINNFINLKNLFKSKIKSRKNINSTEKNNKTYQSIFNELKIKENFKIEKNNLKLKISKNYSKLFNKKYLSVKKFTK